MAITLKYKDHEIVFQESGDLWVCRELDLTANTLSGLKGKIDIFGRSERKVDVRALIVERRFSDQKSSSKNGSRSKVNIDRLISIKDREKAEAWLKLAYAAEVADKRAEAAQKALPYYTVKKLQQDNKK